MLNNERPRYINVYQPIHQRFIFGRERNHGASFIKVGTTLHLHSPPSCTATVRDVEMHGKKAMRHSLSAITTVSAIALGLLMAGRTESAPISAPGAMRAAIDALSPVEQAQLYVYGGKQYCWYGSGWNGPGWYWCGYAWQHGTGWGGGSGWHGWHWHSSWHSHTSWHWHSHTTEHWHSHTNGHWHSGGHHGGGHHGGGHHGGGHHGGGHHGGGHHGGGHHGGGHRR
jgi:hypothetical protein